MEEIRERKIKMRTRRRRRRRREEDVSQAKEMKRRGEERRGERVGRDLLKGGGGRAGQESEGEERDKVVQIFEERMKTQRRCSNNHTRMDGEN